MKRFKFGIPAAILVMGFSFNLTTSFATPEFTKKEKKACTVCHVNAKSKDLNEVGKCYKERNSLTGCETKK